MNDSADKIQAKYSAKERRHAAAITYLNGLGYKGKSFDELANQWLAGVPMEVFGKRKPIRANGSLDQARVIDAIFDEADNVDLAQSPRLASVIQKMNRLARGKSFQPGDDEDGKPIGFDDAK